MSSASVANEEPRYILRFQILPGRSLERDAKTLAKLCLKHKVGEVALFVDAEEWNNGLMSKAEEELWFDVAKRVKEILSGSGLEVSLNIWMTTLHCDRGRKLPAGRNFKPMVSPAGEESRACASFADPAWRKYIGELYGRFASLGFRVLWVEDDFRFHNHAPLKWGGGFEPAVLERFSKKIGKTASREELIDALFAPGEPHPWRALWMETWKELQLEAAKEIAGAVEKSSPRASRMGLMTSHPSCHSAEGRDWAKHFEAFSIKGAVAHRPHFQAYSDCLGSGLSYSFSMLDVQRDLRPANTEVSPEIENFPFTAWTKSSSMTWVHMAVAQLFASDSLLLDVLPFSGNPASEEPEVWKMLDASRPALSWIKARFGKSLATRGVGIPWRQDAQARIRLDKKGDTPFSLYEKDCMIHEAADLLSRYGVASSMRKQEKVNALFGRLAWAFSDEEIKSLLRGGLLLDGAAAKVLCERGFGPEIGVEVEGLFSRESETFSVERTSDSACGLREGLFFNSNSVGAMAKLKLLPGAVEWTEILRPDSTKFGAGVAAFKNKLGGRTVVFAACDPDTLPKSFQRQKLVQSAVDFAANKFDSLFVSGGPHLLAYEFAGAGKLLAVVFNGSPDPAKPKLRLGGRTAGKVEATILKPLAKPAKTAAKMKDGELSVSGAVPYLGMLVVEFE